MQPVCNPNREFKPSGFIGYKFIQKHQKDIVRIYLNCKDESHFEGFVDVIFENKNSNQKKGGAKFSGLDKLSMIKKFNRFIGCLEERAKEIKINREDVFQSSKQLLALLPRVKNSINFI